MNLETLFDHAVEAGASDLILLEDRPVVLRINGALQTQQDSTTPEMLDELWRLVGGPPEANNFDTALVSATGFRFRVNLCRQLGRRGAVLRVIRSNIPELAELGVPAVVEAEWLTRRNGLVLVTGPTGSGKTTTLAACLESINRSRAGHIVTIEDPVEFVFEPKKSIFTQRDVGIDTPSFADGLKQALRQSPDVILIGEIRDVESATTALRAAETGHLILATIHGASIADAIDRVAQLLGGSTAVSLGKVFASQLIGVMCQRLLPATGGELVLAAEYFTNAGATRKYIEESRLGDLTDFISRSADSTACSLMQSVAALCRAGKVTEATAMASVESRSELTRALRGISNNATYR